MRSSRGAVVGATVLLGALALSGCSQSSLVVDGSSVTVAIAQPFTSFNDQSTFGGTASNAAIVGATNAGFTYYNDEPALVRDESFGHFEVVSQDPFEVRYTVANGVNWSDGTPVDAADLLLAWAANSGHLNTPDFNPSRYVDDETGQFAEFPADTVYFDGARRSGLQYVSSVPELGDDGRSITLRYDEFFVDWQLAFDVGLPAHVVAAHSLRFTPKKDESPGATAKAAVIEAIQDGDTASLAKLAAAWNSAFTIGDGTEPELFVGSGPYSVTAVEADRVTLTANPLYTGSRLPRFETVVVTTITDPLAAVEALQRGEVDVIAPAPSDDVLDALAAVDGVDVELGASATFEHLDLQFLRGRNDTFENPQLREAFLLTVPRDEIAQSLTGAELRQSFVLTDGTATAEVRENLSRATSLVASSGVTAPAVCVLFDPSNPRRVAEFEAVKAGAEKAGFAVGDCSTSDWEGFLGVEGSYDAAIFGWTETSTAVSSAEARLRSDSSVSNFSNYSSERVDALLDELSVEDDAATQRELLESIDAELASDWYGLPLYQFPSLVAFDSTIENVSGSALSGPLWNVWEWQPAPKGE